MHMIDWMMSEVMQDSRRPKHVCHEHQGSQESRQDEWMDRRETVTGLVAGCVNGRR